MRSVLFEIVFDEVVPGSVSSTTITFFRGLKNVFPVTLILSTFVITIDLSELEKVLLIIEIVLAGHMSLIASWDPLESMPVPTLIMVFCERFTVLADHELLMIAAQSVPSEQILENVFCKIFVLELKVIAFHRIFEKVFLSI